MAAIGVEYRGGDEFLMTVRGHKIVVDQPASDGGGDAGPTPTELFVASLAGCVAFYARRYLSRHRLSTDGLRVDATYRISTDRPARVAGVDLRVAVPARVTGARLEAMRAVVSHCTVHNSIRTAPQVDIRLETDIRAEPGTHAERDAGGAAPP